MDAREALLILLDHVDYEGGNCRPNDLVGAVLPVPVLRLAKLVAQKPAENTVQTSLECDLCRRGVPHWECGGGAN